MKPIPSKIQFRFHSLCEEARDTGLEDAEQKELQELARTWPGLIDELAAWQVMDAELRYDTRLVKDLAQAVKPSPPLRARTQPMQWMLAAAACAACGLLLNQGLQPTAPAGPAAIATLTKATGCKWAASTLPTAEGSRVSAGTYELVEGLATLKFDSGAEVVIEAPATLELIDAMNCRLRRGTLVSDVPPEAIGFTVDTLKARVVDYGTRFGVSTSADGEYTVQVLSGRVEVEDRQETTRHNLTSGMNLDRGLLKQKVNPTAAPAEPNRWQPDRIIQDGEGWQLLSTGYGRGRDSYIQSPDGSLNYGQDPYFRVKNTTVQPHLNRKGYLTFDLARWEKQTFSGAELILTIEPSDLGFATLVPDSRFLVYGLTDESGDAWEENALTAANAPAHDPALPARHLPVPDKVRLLGEFVIAQGVNRGTCTVGGTDLLTFLQQDTNGLVTFIICRETDETARAGLVHAFTTKENGSNTPPMLRVKPQL